MDKIVDCKRFFSHNFLVIIYLIFSLKSDFKDCDLISILWRAGSSGSADSGGRSNISRCGRSIGHNR